jgi:hypothetical protein
MNEIKMASLSHYDAETGHPEEVLPSLPWNPDAFNCHPANLLRTRGASKTCGYDLDPVTLLDQSLSKPLEHKLSTTDVGVVMH